MYIDYAKLWRLLRERELTKVDLCRATGLSSRTMAKLVANRSVTTDTLLCICEALDCGISDIMEVTRTAPERTLLSVYREAQRGAVPRGGLRTVEFDYKGVAFKIGVSEKSANRHTVIHCRPTGIVWEQIHALGVSPVSEVFTLAAPAFSDREKLCIILIRGNPGNITGLDEGIYLSAKNEYGEGALYVMSEAAFKLFNPLRTGK